MASNARLFDDLVRAGTIKATRSALFASDPRPVSTGFDLGRTDAMMLGVAIGDALGNTTESLPPAGRVRMHGEIRGDLPNRFAGGRAVWLPSDDSQLALAASDVSLTRSHGITPHPVLRKRSTRHE